MSKKLKKNAYKKVIQSIRKKKKIERKKNTHLQFTSSRRAQSIKLSSTIIAQHSIEVTTRVSILQMLSLGPRAALGMPNGAPLDVHLFPVAKQVPALGAFGTGRVEMVVVTRLGKRKIRKLVNVDVDKYNEGIRMIIITY